MRPTPEIIKKLPKVLLHDHLDGGLRVSTIIDLARKERFPLPSEDPQELLAWFHRGANAGDLRLYLETFKVIYAALQTEEALERVAYESLLDLHADNVVYAELRFAPFFHTAKGLTHDEVMEAVLRGLRRAEGETGTRFGLIVCSMRGSQWAMPMAELAVAYRDKGAVAFDLAGDEAGNPAKKDQAAFDFCLRNNFNITIHAGEAFGVLNEVADPAGVMINAAGSAPGDLHKLWQPRHPKEYHVEYGYSTMGYELPAALGVKLAAPDREVVALVGDGTFLMLPSELVTAAQEGLRLTVVLVDNHGYASIGSLSRSLGSGGFGCRYRYRTPDGTLSGEPLRLDFVAIARGMGVHAVRADDGAALRRELLAARQRPETTVIVVECDADRSVGGYESWWDVAVAEVSENPDVQRARADYVEQKKRERHYL